MQAEPAPQPTIYCLPCAEQQLAEWEGWPLKQAVPLLPRLLDGTCEACGAGGRAQLPSHCLGWINIHALNNTGLPNYWKILTTATRWGCPYYGETTCPRCAGRAIVSQMIFPGGSQDFAGSCDNCGLVRLPPRL